MVNVGPKSPRPYVRRKAVYEAPAQEVEPAFPPALAGDARPSIKPLENSSGRRTALAEWLASPRNPQTGRGVGDRLLHFSFGKGIVGAPSDFGVRGDRPTALELLDYLAEEVLNDGWSVEAK